MVPVFKDIPLYKSPIDKPAVLRQLDEDVSSFHEALDGSHELIFFFILGT